MVVFQKEIIAGHTQFVKMLFLLNTRCWETFVNFMARLRTCSIYAQDMPIIFTRPLKDRQDCKRMNYVTSVNSQNRALRKYFYFLEQVSGI